MTTSVTRKKFGVIGNPFADPRGGMELPSDQPTPPRDLVLKIWEDEYKRRKTLFNINGVSYKEMALRLGIDEKPAMRVAEARSPNHLRRLTIFLKFERIDRSHVERWRPLIRFDNKFLTAGYPRSPVDLAVRPRSRAAAIAILTARCARSAELSSATNDNSSARGLRLGQTLIEKPAAFRCRPSSIHQSRVIL
jgi:hypothetical protein